MSISPAVLAADSSFLAALVLIGLRLGSGLPSELMPRGRPVSLPLGLLLGAAAYMILGTALLPLMGGVPLILAALGGAAALAVVTTRRPPAQHFDPVTVMVASLVVALAAQVGLRELVHPDSFDNTALAGLLAADATRSARPFLLLTRPPGLALLQLPAIRAGAQFTLAPIVAVWVSTWVLVIGVAGRILRGRLGRSRRLLLVAASGTILLVPFTVVQATYLNAHVIVAGLLTVATVATLVASRPSGEVTTLWAAIGLPAAALVVTRPDGIFLAAVVLAVAFASAADWRPVRRAFLTVGLTTLVWWGYLAAVVVAGGLWGVGIADALASLTGRGAAILPVLFVGLALVLIASLPASAVAFRTGRRTRWSLELLPWVIALGAILTAPTAAGRSIRAIGTNMFLGAGEWTMAPAVLLVGLVLLMAAGGEGNRWIVRYPVTAFIPLMLTLRLLEGGAFRVGWSDSLNRSLVHVGPLLLLAVLLGAARVAGSAGGRASAGGGRQGSGSAGARTIDRRTSPYPARFGLILGLVALAVLTTVPRATPTVVPLRTAVDRIDPGLDRLRGVTGADADVAAVVLGDTGRDAIRRLALVREGPTEFVGPDELEAVLVERPPDLLVVPACAHVPDWENVVASDLHRAREGLLSPGPDVWRSILLGESGRPDTVPEWWTVRSRDAVPAPATSVTEVLQPTYGPAGLDPDPLGVIRRLAERATAAGLPSDRTPADAGLVCVSASSVLYGEPEGIVDRSGILGPPIDGSRVGLLHTDDDVSAWVTLDLGPLRSIELSGVGLRQRPDDGAALLREVVVEIRLAGGWLPVARGLHEGGPGEWSVVEVEGAPATSGVRIRLGGVNSSGTGHLVLDDVELFGSLHESVVAEAP